MPPAGLKPPDPKTVELKRWKGVNRTDSRTQIGDEEFSWLENALTVGNGAIQLVPAQAAAIATIAVGIASLWEATTSTGVLVLLSINTDGSISQITTAGAVTAVAPAGTVTTAAHVTLWRNTLTLLVDPTKGYFSWDGVSFSTIDATKVGAALAVFEGRVWIANGRTVTFTAPNTFNDFVPGDGSGSTLITDEAFLGSVLGLVSAFEELWVIGPAAIDVVSNVAATGVSPNVVTTFSVTNITSGLGSPAPNSALGYFRALAFVAPYGIFALVGVTPQKLSDKLDGLFPQLTLTPDVPAALAVIQDLLCLLFLVTYTGPDAIAAPGPTPLLLGFTGGRWFFASQGAALKWVTTLTIAGVPQAWGTDGQHVYQLFAAPAATAVSYKIQWRLSDFGSSVTQKQLLKFGLEFQASLPIAPLVTVESEAGSAAVQVSTTNVLTFTGASGAIITFTGAGPITWTSQGLVLARSDASMAGRYLGWTITGTDPPYRLSAVQLEVLPGREWWVP